MSFKLFYGIFTNRMPTFSACLMINLIVADNNFVWNFAVFRPADALRLGSGFCFWAQLSPFLCAFLFRLFFPLLLSCRSLPFLFSLLFLAPSLHLLTYSLCSSSPLSSFFLVLFTLLSAFFSSFFPVLFAFLLSPFSLPFSFLKIPKLALCLRLPDAVREKKRITADIDPGSAGRKASNSGLSSLPRI